MTPQLQLQQVPKIEPAQHSQVLSRRKKSCDTIYDLAGTGRQELSIQTGGIIALLAAECALIPITKLAISKEPSERCAVGWLRKVWTGQAGITACLPRERNRSLVIQRDTRNWRDRLPKSDLQETLMLTKHDPISIKVVE